MREQESGSVTGDQLKRYNLVTSASLFEELQRLADKEGTTVVELIRKSIKLLLLISKTESNLNTESGFFYRDEQGREQRLIIM